MRGVGFAKDQETKGKWHPVSLFHLFGAIYSQQQRQRTIPISEAHVGDYNKLWTDGRPSIRNQN